MTMIKRPEAIQKAERLRYLMRMPGYEETVGAWIVELEKSALHNLVTATEIADFHRAQGQYKAFQSLRDSIDYIWQAEQAAINKESKK